MNPYWWLLLTNNTLFRCSYFLPSGLFCSRTPSGEYILSYIYLGSWLQFARLSLFDDFDSFEDPLKGFVWCFSPDWTGVMAFGEGHQRENTILSTSYQGCTLQPQLFPADSYPTCLAEVLKHFLCSFCFPLSMLCSLKEVTMHNPHLKSRELSSTSSRAEYLHQLFGIFLNRKDSLFPPLIYLCDIYMCISMGSWTFILYLGF